MSLKYIWFAVFLLLFQLLLAQEGKTFTHNALAEKIYLQLDSDVYTTNKTIWFKAVLTNAVTHKSDYTSGVLYVELINANKTIVDSKLIKITSGIGQGHFDLNRSYEQGTYLIRAYTEWSKNFGTDFLFETYVQLFSETPNEKTCQPIHNIRRVDSTENTQVFRADLYPQYIDATHQKRLEVYVTEDNTPTDTLQLESSEGHYTLNYEAKKVSKQLELAFKTKNGHYYKTLFSPQLNYVDLQFFPEGGTLVDGLPCNVGFKALGHDGKGFLIEGDILNDAGDEVASFRSNVLGMGSFILENPSTKIRYKARFKGAPNQEFQYVYLPLVKPKGYAISVTEKDSNLIVSVQSNFETNRKVELIGACRGYQYLAQENSLIDGRYVYVFPKYTFPEGVIAFTLLNQNKQPVAERLYFNQRLENRLDINASLNKLRYNPRDEIKVDLHPQTFSKKSIPSNTSLLVVNTESSVSNHNYRETILSYMLLDSDLRGEIENPGYYFEVGHNSELDYLMLTQGWRNYNYKASPKKMNYKQEKSLHVSGIVNLKNKKNKKKHLEELELMLMTFDSIKSVYSTSIQVPGSFSFDLEDMYGDFEEISVQSMTGEEDMNISLNQKKVPPITFDYTYMSRATDSVAIVAANKYRRQKSLKDQYDFNTYGMTKLDEIVIDAYKMTPKRQEVFDKYGKPRIVIEGDDIRQKEKDWNWGLYSVLHDFFPDKVRIDINERGDLSARVLGESTLIIVDGYPVMPEFYNQLQYISVDEVTSFEILETAKNFAKLYIRVHGHGPIIPNFGGIISIYTKRGIGLFGALDLNQKSLNSNEIKVFTHQKEFYTPQYNASGVNDNANPDLRTPVYWKPQITSQDNGKASVTFYHSDDEGRFQVILESISQSGQIGYQILEYTVEKKTN